MSGFYRMPAGAYARSYVAAALLGSWAKIGKSKYQRSTGETVARIGPARWRILERGEPAGDYLSCYAAISAVDYKHRPREG